VSSLTPPLSLLSPLLLSSSPLFLPLPYALAGLSGRHRLHLSTLLCRVDSGYCARCGSVGCMDAAAVPSLDTTTLTSLDPHHHTTTTATTTTTSTTTTQPLQSHSTHDLVPRTLDRSADECCHAPHEHPSVPIRTHSTEAHSFSTSEAQCARLVAGQLTSPRPAHPLCCGPPG
jgi:hypothetical protein